MTCPKVTDRYIYEDFIYNNIDLPLFTLFLHPCVLVTPFSMYPSIQFIIFSILFSIFFYTPSVWPIYPIFYHPHCLHLSPAQVTILIPPL